MKYIYTLFCLLISLFSFSQNGNTNYTIKGKVIEENGTAIPFVSVVLKLKSTQKLLKGTTTDFNGEFLLDASNSNVYLEVSFVGYGTVIKTDLVFDNPQINLKEIVLKVNNKLIEEVEIVAERSSTEFKLDKRVFNVGKDLASSGASGLEVLNNVPSVNVDIEGTVSLRGLEGVQILINGKPSILTDESGNGLGTITADMISKVEVITNPSAKYEAEGTSGIINIILKKESKKGTNGSVSLNTGIPGNHSLGFSINRRGEKFNIFSQLGAGYRSLPRYSQHINKDLVANTELTSEGTNYRNEQFYNIVLGTDYNLTKNDVITLSGNVAYEIESQPSETNFTFINALGDIDKVWTRNEETDAVNPKYQYELKYKKDFKNHKKHDLLFSLVGNYFGKDQSSLFSNTVIEGTNNFFNQKTKTYFKEGKNTINLDYTKPIGKHITLETGAQYLINNVSNEYEVLNESSGVYVVDTSLTNTFEYNQNVLGVYGTGSYEKKKWGVKLGLRIEQTDLSTLLINTNEKNNQNFTNLFPSAHTSYKLNDKVSFQIGYSSRVFRPRLWDLNPFFNISNNFNIKTGNPNLLPEYTDSYELGSIFVFDKMSFNVNVYDKYTTQVIEEVSIFENGVNTHTPYNLGTRNTAGIELNYKYSPNKVFSIHGDANYNLFVRKGTFENQVFDFIAYQWQSKLTGKYKVNKKLDIELSGNYRSRVQTIQGIVSGNIFSNLGLRYKILKGKGVLNASVRDIFASRYREIVVDQEDFYLYSYGQRGRFITLGFSYGFGKGEAMQYSGGRRR